MNSLLIIYSDGTVDPIRIQPDECLRYAELCHVMAGRFLHNYQSWCIEQAKAKELLSEPTSLESES